MRDSDWARGARHVRGRYPLPPVKPSSEVVFSAVASSPAHQISPMVSSSSPSTEEGGHTRHGEKRRMRGGAAASPEPGPAAAASQDFCSSRGCEEDFDGATTTHGKWRQDESHRPEIDDAPIFSPTEEEFKDAIGYITSIRPLAEKYGICRIIPPSSWRPPCPLKEKSFWECTEFNTRVQQVDKLQNREPTKKRTQLRVQKKRKRRKRLRFGMTHRRPSTNASENADCADSDEKFGFQSGSDFTLEEFQKYADEFKQQYFGMKRSDEISLAEIKNRKEIWEPSVEEIEGEYWRIVVCPTDEVEVDYGADLDTTMFSSGFAKLSSSAANRQDPYALSCWNLNNLPRLPGSVLSFEHEDISGVVVPWLYAGMCFSSFCWHVEDHFLYSLNYMHFGEPKVWYGIPGGEAVKLEESMRKNLPKLFEEQPDLLHDLVTQLSPSVLKSEGVPVYRVVQKPGEFVLTLPRAYHSGFNCGFNCAEAVNVAPVDWLPHGQCAVELYREQRRKTSISHDKLLLKTAKEAVRQLWMNIFDCKSDWGKYRWLDTCGKDGVLTSAIKTRVKMEDAAREANALLKSKKMDRDYDSTDRECFSCFYDLHLSAVCCQCSPNRFSCLNHANLLCSCEMDRKFTFFRYSMEELNSLVKALEGDLTAVAQWGQDDLGLVCPSGSVQQRKVDLVKGTESLGSVIHDVGSSCSDNQGHCPDHEKPAGYQQQNGTQNKYLDLNIEDPPSSSRIKEELVRSSDIPSAEYFSRSTTIVLGKHEKDRMVVNYEPLQRIDNSFSSTSECSCSLSLNCSSKLLSPSRIQISNSDLASNPTKKLFGVDIGNLAKPSDGQVIQMAKPSSSKSDVVSSPISMPLVEPLDYGTIMIGKKWSNNQAIFPKGFRSRVIFDNIQDPTWQCCYISEVLDGGPLGPLFRVTIEQVPEVSFIDTSPMRCWYSVRDRVNEEIKKLQRVGKSGLPGLLAPDSVNGLEMFGFLSPQIIQEIEALDPHHQCLDYWLSKPSFPVKVPPSEVAKAKAIEGSNNSHIRLLGVEITRSEPEQSSFCSNSCADEVTLGRLPKKAKLPEGPELVVMNEVFSSGVDNSRRICRDSSHYAG
ncbi:lysine-specific demethylase JMJ18-like [Phragmites australis]|uniref:lysine-specific demethylase JMJ18-like n=1 Tax=Phragmites australis TaxID=29695 RepID=UPI002D780619|nr:lysine-specific demethylase JMJ18-like [Phragmites australis]